ncbi:type I phosphomannose isomerase catalytic subunit [Lancefieldella sp. Marseille-Q7238]|uniref:type I phosphomannose isomerase catalytic subunit n=1 Tax=Lancefieldella sp. Marseille-Q7238 TaxID=3022127 RepID=UPI0024A99BE9|nr:type I phosphomannose isomerase catalytic subunit [Lancefieldella sp. Marseille-Q7238]
MSTTTTHDCSHDIIVLTPIFHEKIWGGRRLADDFGYDIPDGDIGECWAISAHPNGDCTVASGVFAGKTLSELWDEHRELFSAAQGDRFPLLIKILDAREDLSVQVHPDDAYAAEHENGSLGKRECWYVLDAEPNTTIIIGQRAHNRKELACMIDEGRWNDMLNFIPVHKGDFFRIDPGTVHAIKGGTLILETQQSSDVTYRVYDYDRLGVDGKPRELHIQQSLDVVDYDLVPPVSGKVAAPEIDGITNLMTCDNFVVDRVVVSGERMLKQPHPFLCVSVIEGDGTVATSAAGKPHTLTRGSHFIVPAGSGDLTLTGTMTLITSYVPEG